MLIVGPLVVLAVQMAREAVVIVRGVRELRETGFGTPEWVPQLPFVGGYVASWWAGHLADPDAAKELGRAESMAVIQWSRSFGSELVGRLVILVFTLLPLFFTYRDGSTIIDQTRIVADRLFGPSGEHLGKEAVVAVRATINGLVLVGLAEGALLGVAYVMAGVSHPVLFGFATGLLATVPFGAAARIRGRLPHADRSIPSQRCRSAFLVRVGCRFRCRPFCPSRADRRVETA